MTISESVNQLRVLAESQCFKKETYEALIVAIRVMENKLSYYGKNK